MARIDPLEPLMLRVVRDGDDDRFLIAGEAGETVHVGRDSVGEEQHVASGLEPARGLGPVADRHHRDALGAQPLERLVERDRHALDQYQQRHRSGRRRAARLIFDQCLAGEREQGPKAARLILLIRPDQRAERHNALPI